MKCVGNNFKLNAIFNPKSCSEYKNSEEPNSDYDEITDSQYNINQKIKVCKNLNYNIDIFNNILINICPLKEQLNALLLYTSSYNENIIGQLVLGGAWNTSFVQGFNGLSPTTPISSLVNPDINSEVLVLKKDKKTINMIKNYLSSREKFLYYLHEFINDQTDLFDNDIEGDLSDDNDYDYIINSELEKSEDYYGKISFKWRDSVYGGYNVVKQNYLCYSKIKCEKPMIDKYIIMCLGNEMDIVSYPPSDISNKNDFNKITLNFNLIDFTNSFEGGRVITDSSHGYIPVNLRNVLNILGSISNDYFLYDYNSTSFTSSYDKNTIKYFLSQDSLMIDVLCEYLIGNLNNIRKCGGVINKSIKFHKII